jgi:hypothetical protein
VFLIKKKKKKTLCHADPNSKAQSGPCVAEGKGEQIRPGICKGPSRWLHDGNEGPLKMKETGLCLQDIADCLPPLLAPDCSRAESTWEPVLTSKLHLAAKDHKGKYICAYTWSLRSLKIS